MAKVQVPAYFDAREALRNTLSQPERDSLGKLVKSTRALLSEAQGTASRLEFQGDDTSYLRAALGELAWRVGSTLDVEAIRASRARCEMALTDPTPPSVLIQDRDGSYGLGTLAWFLKLDATTDQLVDGPWPGKRPPRFLDCINTPDSMIKYLDKLLVCDLAGGVDYRKELNLASAVIARLALWGGQAGYLQAPAFEKAYRRFLGRWQDADTGFFCATYKAGGQTVKTVDLSLTFHMARYASRYHPGDIGHWPKLIETLFVIKDPKRVYPQGWFDDGGAMTNHNNYDVVELWRLGWPHMTKAQKANARHEMRGMLDWCLNHSIQEDGVVINSDLGDTVPENYYFAAAFLDTLGYLDGEDVFGVGGNFSNGPPLRARMIRQLSGFCQDLPDTLDALARLGVGPKRF